MAGVDLHVLNMVVDGYLAVEKDVSASGFASVAKGVDMRVGVGEGAREGLGPVCGGGVAGLVDRAVNLLGHNHTVSLEEVGKVGYGVGILFPGLACAGVIVAAHKILGGYGNQV